MEGGYNLLDLPTDVWTHILEGLVLYDIGLLQTTCKHILKICSPSLSRRKPPKQDLMQYFVELGAISCLDYCHSLGREWDARTMNAAASKGRLEVIEFLYANGCEYDEFACASAATEGHLDCLKYMHEKGFPWHSVTTNGAVLSKNLEILKYVHENGCEWGSNVLQMAAACSVDCLKYALDNNCEIDLEEDNLCEEAARRGNLDSLKLLFEAGFSKNRSCEAAAYGGHLECLKYAHENGAEWGTTLLNAACFGNIACIRYVLENGDNSLITPNHYSSSIEQAVLSNSIDCVRLLREYGGEWTGKEYSLAAYTNNLQMIKYLLTEAGCPKPTTSNACLSARGLGVLKYLHENGFSWDGKLESYDEEDSNDYYDIDEDSYRVAPSHTLAYKIVKRKSLPSLTYIIECGYEIDTKDVSLCSAAASNNDIEMLDYLMDLGCECEQSIMSVAARSGSLEALKYLHEMGFEWDDNVTLLAAETGRSEVLEYALANGCGYSSLVCSVAANREHLKCLKIAHKYGVPWTANACNAAVTGTRRTSHLSCLKYLHENGCPWSHQECTKAVQFHDLKILKYVHENGSQWSTETWYTAVKRDAINCLKYLYDNGCPQDPRTYTTRRSKQCSEFWQKSMQTLIKPQNLESTSLALRANSVMDSSFFVINGYIRLDKSKCLYQAIKKHNIRTLFY